MIKLRMQTGFCFQASSSIRPGLHKHYLVLPIAVNERVLFAHVTQKLSNVF